jgi:F420-dependent oxidoreductase-like protein
MRLSVWPSSSRSFDEILAVARHCEVQGWYGVYLADHFMPDDPSGEPRGGPMLECLAVMAALASATTRIRIGSLVLGNRYRHPAVVAKMATTIDAISGGRTVLGLGAGWQQNEHRAYGIELGSVKDRLDHFEEAVEVIRSLLRHERTTFEGRFYQLKDAPCDPKPISALPLVVGGRGEKRTMRIAARWADEWNAWCTPDVLVAKSAVLRAHCEEVGRDPSTIRRSTQAMLVAGDDPGRLAEQAAKFSGRPVIVGGTEAIIDQVGTYAAAGADELIIPDWNLGPVDETLDMLDQFFDVVTGAGVVEAS